jgi:RND superfamily putative drug exporter
VGRLLLRRAGTVWLATVAVMTPFVVVGALYYNQLSYDLISELPGEAASVQGTRVLQAHFPAGVMGPVTALLVDERVDFAGERGRALVAHVTDRLRAGKDAIGLADVRSLAAPLGITAAAAQSFKGIHVSREVRESATREGALEYYVADLDDKSNVVTRLVLVLAQNPFSERSIEDLDKVERAVRDALPADARQAATVYYLGTTASVRDLTLIEQGDRTRIEVLVLTSVFVILVVLLRRLVVSVYLLLSVLFSYYTTLGLTFALFWALDPAGFTGLDWKVAIFLFTILIAVGEDYNIFLMTRVDEEQRRYGPLRGITEALDRTGPIISSCGIIMAGTFGSLLAGTLTEMKQLGFALAFGVLLDTFVVRPILVPAFLILLHGGRLRLPGRTSPARGSTDAPAPTARAG